MELTFSIKFRQLKNNPKALPRKPGVYLFKEGKVYLYVGKTTNLRQRLTSSSHVPFQIASQTSNVKIYYCVTDEIGIESFLIDKFKPIWNSKISNTTCRTSKTFYDEEKKGTWFIHTLGWYCNINGESYDGFKSFLPDGITCLNKYQQSLEKVLAERLEYAVSQLFIE